jgi:hypothetical protein
MDQNVIITPNLLNKRQQMELSVVQLSHWHNVITHKYKLILYKLDLLSLRSTSMQLRLHLVTIVNKLSANLDLLVNLELLIMSMGILQQL